MRTLILMAVVLAGSYSMAQGTSRISLKDLGLELPKQQQVTNRYVGDSGSKLTASCQENQILESATCQAQEAGTFGFESLLRTSTRLVTEGPSSHAECSALFLRMDQIVRLTLVLKCSDHDSQKTAKNN